MRLLASWALAAVLLSCGALRANTFPAVAPMVAVPSGSDVVTFAVIGDFGRAGIDEENVANLVKSWSPNFIVTVGDNNYSRGAAETIDANIGYYYHDYIRYDQNYTGPYKDRGSKDQRFFAALGNHDWLTDGARPYLDYFELPGNERYYRVRQGPVELFALDSDSHEPDGVESYSRQAAWLRAALRDSTAPWKVVTMHHPPYSRGWHGSETVMRWPFKQWGASVVLAGHDHHFERIQLDGLTYYVVGTGGAELRPVFRPSIAGATVDLAYSERHGALLAVANATALVLRFYDVDKHLIDAYRLETPSLQ